MALFEVSMKGRTLGECSIVSKDETEQVNERVRRDLMTAGKKHSAARGSYTDHTPEYREVRYEECPSRCLVALAVPETMVRRVPSKSAKFKKTANNVLGKSAKFCTPQIIRYTVYLIFIISKK